MKLINFIKMNKIEMFIILTVSSILGSFFLGNSLYLSYKNTHTLTFSIYEIIPALLVLISSIFTLSLYLKLNSKKIFLQNANKDKPLQNSVLLATYSCTIIVILTSFSIYIINQPSAFSMPALDMGPFFERYTDQNFAPNDFLTNASSHSNPRMVFGYIVITLQKIFQTDWYTIFHGLLIFFTITIPALYFLVIISALRNKISNDSRYILAIAVSCILTLTVFINKIAVITSIGWWSPLFLGPAAQTMSVFLVLVFSLLALNIRSEKVYFAIPLLFASVFIHPTIGISGFIFFLIISFQFAKLRFYTTSLFVGIFSAGILLIGLFKQNSTLSAQDFIYNYITENHSFHYQISNLASFTAIPWYFSFILILSTLLLFAIISNFLKDKYLLMVSLASFSAYTLCVGIQFLFVEIYPTKIIAELGPVRFSSFMFWILLFLFSYFIARYLPNKLVPAITIHAWFSKKILISILSCVIFLLFIIGMQHKDNPTQTFSQEYPGLISWTETNTLPTDVFVTFPSFFPFHVPLILKRSIFFGNGFPFSEQDFIEYNERKGLVYGLESEKKHIPGTQPWEDTMYFYRGLTPIDFVNAAKKFQLDYIIVESNFSENFSLYPPIYQDKNIKIYSVQEIMRAPNTAHGN